MDLRTSLLVLAGLAASAAGGPGMAAAAEATKPDLMPLPAKLEWQPGQLLVDGRFSLGVTGASDPRIDAALARARARLEGLSKLTLVARPAGAKATLVVQAAAAGLPVQVVGEDESYELTVTPKQARLTAPTPLGVLRGLETFLQLARVEGGRTVVPAVTVSDRPRFAWRGLMIDVCRRWQPIDVLKRNLDGMASVKLNVLHWHLSEDQGFRIESKVFPKLQELGSDGKYYTQDQVREVIAYARERGIRVVPEFDLPGHSTSWLVAHPELGAAPGPFQIVREWGIFDNVLDPSKDEVYAFLDKFFGEMAGLFPDAYMHIGGDEVTPRQWNASARVQDFIYTKNLDGAHGIQAYFNQRVNEIFTRHGKRMVGWDEILSPELPKNIVVHSWRGPRSLAEAARQGYDGILSAGYYIDLLHPASDHYLSDPIPPDSTLSADQRTHILGGEATMWSEFVSPETVDSRIWPRTAAIAERLWSPAEVRDVADMYRRLEVESVRLDALGLKHLASYEPMLARIAGGKPTASLHVLADLVTPIKDYRRGSQRVYTSSTPLERLVDAARADSLAIRSAQAELDRYLTSAPASRDDAALRRILSTWRDNHSVLEPILTASALGQEVRPLSRNLAALGTVGLEALDAIKSGTQAPATWTSASRAVVERAGHPVAELDLAPVPMVGKLVLAASTLDQLKTLSPEEWNRKLDEQIRAASGERGEH
jgi:hexosaminidase